MCVHHVEFDDISSILSIRSIEKEWRKRDRERESERERETDMVKLPFVILVVMGGVRYIYINMIII